MQSLLASLRSQMNATLPTRCKHNDALDGLRALAIVSVVCFHLRPSAMTGGFIGVTLFLVLAGYLCTTSLLRVLNADQHLHYWQYLLKRLHRIWPSVLGIIAFSAPLMWLCAPSLLPKLQADTLSSATFTGNIGYIVRHVSYFEQAGLPSPIKHLWYVGLVMQAFLIWPIILLLLTKLVRSTRLRLLITLILMLISAITSSVIAMQSGATSITARVYYALDTRASEFLVGAMLAMYYEYRKQQAYRNNTDTHTDSSSNPSAQISSSSHQVTLTTIATIAILAYIWLIFTDVNKLSWLSHGGYTLIACGFAVIIAACVSTQTWLTHILSIAPLTYLGTRAFSLYLVHFPILEILNPATRTINATWLEQILQLAIVVLAGEGFYRLFEMPLAQRTVSLKLKDDNQTQLSGSDVQVSTKELHTTLRARRIMIMLCTSITIILVIAPLRWNDIAMRRSLQLRPELRQFTQNNVPHTPTRHTAIKHRHLPKLVKRALPPTPAPERVLNPIAEKVPANLRTSRWKINNQRDTCSADFTMVGDSITKGAEPYILHALPYAYIDGKVSRQSYEGANVYTQLARNGKAGSVVVYALGTNGLIQQVSQLEQMVQAAQGRPVYFVTLRVPQSQQDPNNTLLRSFAATHQNVGIIDWHGLTTGHSEFLADDGIHVTPTGGRMYARMMRLAMCGG